MSETDNATSPLANDANDPSIDFTNNNIDTVSDALEITAVQPKYFTEESNMTPFVEILTESSDSIELETTTENSPHTEAADKEAVVEEPPATDTAANMTPLVEIPTESSDSIDLETTAEILPHTEAADKEAVVEESPATDIAANMTPLVEIPTESSDSIHLETTAEIPPHTEAADKEAVVEESPATDIAANLTPLVEIPTESSDSIHLETTAEIPPHTEAAGKEAVVEEPPATDIAAREQPAAVESSPFPSSIAILEKDSLKNGPLRMLKKTDSAFIDPQVASPSTSSKQNTYDLSALKRPSSRAAEAVTAANSATLTGRSSSPAGDQGAVPKLKQVNATLQVKEDGTVFSFSDQEKQAFSEHINICLAGDKAVKHLLPIDPETDDLFVKFSNGLLLCKLVNCAKIDSIDERAMNLDPNMNNYKKAENQNLALNAARSIGCQVINVGAADLLKGTPSLVLGLLWQVIRIQLLGLISLKNVPELVLLLLEGETMAAFLALNPEIILMRWLNFHLKRAKSSRVVKNFTKDLLDSEVYGAVLQQLSPEHCDKITEKDPMARATHVIKNAKELGVNVFIKPEHVCSGVKSLNTSFVAQIFNTCHGLNLPVYVPDESNSSANPDRHLSLSRESIEDEIRAALNSNEGDNPSDSREVRVFSMWINSLNVADLYIQHLFLDIDGASLLHVIDKVEPGSVIWKRVNKAANMNMFKKIENANYVIQLGKEMKFSLVNVGGTDIVDGNKKLILAFVWQLMRLYTLNVLANLARQTGLVTGGSGVTEAQIIKWANKKVEENGGTSKMKSFKDSSMKDSFFFLELVSAIESSAVSWDYVKRPPTAEKATEGEKAPQLEEEDLLSNAKYVISCARKMGAMVFVTPEDIVEVKSKMLLTFVASLWATELDPDRATAVR